MNFNYTVWLDIILSRFDWYRKIKEFVAQVIVFTEITGEQGPVKRDLAIKTVREMLNTFGLKLTIPDFIVNQIIGIVIDSLITFLNTTYGKDWIKKVQDFFKTA